MENTVDIADRLGTQRVIQINTFYHTNDKELNILRSQITKFDARKYPVDVIINRTLVCVPRG